MNADLINGCLEFFGAVLVCLNVKRILIDKKVSGVSLVPVFFFDLWGYWNLYYYPSLDQWWSFAGGAFMASVNCLWTGLALYYGGYFSGIKKWINGWLEIAAAFYNPAPIDGGCAHIAHAEGSEGNAGRTTENSQ